jgi:hypothetical protein
MLQNPWASRKALISICLDLNEKRQRPPVQRQMVSSLRQQPADKSALYARPSLSHFGSGDHEYRHKREPEFGQAKHAHKTVYNRTGRNAGNWLKLPVFCANADIPVTFLRGFKSVRPGTEQNDSMPSILDFTPVTPALAIPFKDSSGRKAKATQRPACSVTVQRLLRVYPRLRPPVANPARYSISFMKLRERLDRTGEMNKAPGG